MWNDTIHFIHKLHFSIGYGHMVKRTYPYYNSIFISFQNTRIIRIIYANVDYLLLWFHSCVVRSILDTFTRVSGLRYEATMKMTAISKKLCECLSFLSYPREEKKKTVPTITDRIHPAYGIRNTENKKAFCNCSRWLLDCWIVVWVCYGSYLWLSVKNVIINFCIRWKLEVHPMLQ